MTIQELVNRARKAQAEIANYTQEQVDKLVYDGAKIIYENAKPLARLAVDETGLGCYEDKIGKNTGIACWCYWCNHPCNKPNCNPFRKLYARFKRQKCSDYLPSASCKRNYF